MGSQPDWYASGLGHVWRPYAQMKTEPDPLPVVRALGSRLVRGTFEAHAAVEAKVAALKGAEAALLFASGWQANAAVLPALFAAGEGPALAFADRLVHASLHQGCQAAGRW